MTTFAPTSQRSFAPSNSNLLLEKLSNRLGRLIQANTSNNRQEAARVAKDMARFATEFGETFGEEHSVDEDASL